MNSEKIILFACAAIGVIACGVFNYNAVREMRAWRKLDALRAAEVAACTPTPATTV